MKVALLACSIVLFLSLSNQQDVLKKKEPVCRGKYLPVTLLDVGGPKLPEPRTLSLLKGGINTRTRLIIRDPERWKELWEQILGTQQYRPPPPKVDFSREMLIVAAMGQRGSPSYEIVITGGCEVDNQVEVYVRSSDYTKCGGSQLGVVTAPVDIVRIAKSDLPVVFRETEFPSSRADCKELLGQAPQFELKDLQGRTVRLSDYKGKVVLINFWATWCPPCRAEIPDLIRLQREYAEQGLQIVGITYPPESKDRVRRFARRLKVNYPIALGTRQIKARFSSDETLPLTVVINRDGTVSEIISGILLREEFDEKIKPLLMKQMEGEVRNAKSDR